MVIPTACWKYSGVCWMAKSAPVRPAAPVLERRGLGHEGPDVGLDQVPEVQDRHRTYAVGEDPAVQEGIVRVVGEQTLENAHMRILVGLDLP